MAFANLFARLSAVEEDVTRPASTHRNDSAKGANGRKRKKQADPSGPHKKKQRYQAHITRSHNATSFKEEDSRAKYYPVHNTDGDHATADFDKEVINNHGGKARQQGWNYKSKSNCNVNKQQKKKKPKKRKNQQQQKEGWRPANRGGGCQTRSAWRKDERDGKNNSDKKERPRFMTQEFKDQNAVLVDGRLVCRHFLWGRCIKDTECQLEHIQCYNDLIKEACKFYIQGFCTKGESCPYMHKSFPCKFFHRKGKCFQGADCKFSHEPLNDVTSQLLNEAIKRDNELKELTKKAEQESPGQPENTESEITEAGDTPDALLQPLRPNFYNSAETNSEKETLLCQTEEPTEILEEADPPRASDTARSDIPPSSNLNHEEPVCYSVAAVLGPQLSKPFPSFFTTLGSHESGPLASSDCTSGSANQNEVPYSVDAVLRSFKSENSSFGLVSPPPPAQTVSYTPKTDFEEITDTTNEVNTSKKKMFKSLPSLQKCTGLISKTCPRLTLASSDHKKQSGNMPESPKTTQKAAHEMKLEVLQSAVSVGEKSSKNTEDIKGSINLPTDVIVNCKSAGVLPPGRTCQTSTPKNPAQPRPHLCALTSDSQSSIKLFSSLPEFKGGAPAEPVTSSTKTSDSANSATAKQPTEVHPHSKKTQSALKLGAQQHHSNEIPAVSSSKMAHGGDLAVECKSTQKRPFHSLFASPITDTLWPIGDSTSRSSRPQSSHPAPQFAAGRSNFGRSAVKAEKASASSFHSLFAAPLSAAPPPCVQSQSDHSRTSCSSLKSHQSVDNTSQSSNAKQRDVNLETALPHQVRTDVKEISHAPTSPNFSPNPKLENEDSSAEHVNQPTKEAVNPICSPVSDSLSETSTSPAPCGNTQSITSANQQLPHKGSEKAATANSVLKTLFQSLSPYQQDGDQQDSHNKSPSVKRRIKAAHGVSL
ncbi:zinc finger CCCH domain-containing protein 6-like [Plectropomus leopardus]|uniref:zinc finger CCCH domain-containing protein 6-like n=1 Tax=Plectropomus leopardus TaxID=160734 RepID=UPI001C4B29C7|nr:zinc finger CCCH domain-containing protein 6-like [Plectropomus leopardus]